MSGVKHTPGRWRTVGVHQGHPQHLRLFGPDGKRVCYLPQAYTDEAKRLNEANARLIAAAPDLEQDGSFLLDRLDEFASELQDDDVARQFYGHVSPAMARFRAAIARARGEQSPNHSDQKEVGNG